MKKCAEIIRASLADRVEWIQDNPDNVSDSLLEVTRKVQVTFLLSWGGPSDGFTFTLDGDGAIESVRYFYADWGDHAEVEVRGDDFEAVVNMFEPYLEVDR